MRKTEQNKQKLATIIMRKKMKQYKTTVGEDAAAQF